MLRSISMVKMINLTSSPIFREHKQDVKVMKIEPDTNKIITYEEEKMSLVLGITSIFTVWMLFK